MSANRPNAQSVGPARRLMRDINLELWMVAGNELPFLPIDAIESLANKTRIEEVLQDPDLRIPAEHISDLVHRIQKLPAKKVFLTFVRCEMWEYIGKLWSTDFLDDDLPITVNFDRSQAKYVVKSGRKSPTIIEIFEGSSWAEFFATKQFSLLAPIFQSSVFEYTLSRGTPLPLIEKGGALRSGFSAVYKVKVHRSHIEGMNVLALKELGEMPDQDKYLDKERKNLVALRELDDPNLIKPVAICIGREKAAFFFPWADGGNLRDFWKRNDPADDPATVGWMLKQMTGLCGAVKSLATNNCRHSDLKPENILHFPEGKKKGTLKITDVGLSKFHILVTSRRLNGTTAKHTTERYCPPEFDPRDSTRRLKLVDGADLKLSRRFDIWSLGCVFVEFLIWAILGQKQLENFGSEMGSSKRFWEFDNRSNSYLLSPSADDWIEQLKSKEKAPVLDEVLTLISEGMLVTDWNSRLMASKVYKKMHTMLQKALDEPRVLLGESNPPIGLTSEQALNLSQAQRVPEPGDQTASLSDTGDVEPVTSSRGLTTTAPLDTTAAQNQSAELRDQWTVHTDNKFAQSFFSQVGKATPREGVQLCNECSKFSFWEPEFTISEVVSEFAARSSRCGLCKLLYAVSKGLGLGEGEQLRCIRRASTMNMIGHDSQPILSLFADPDGQSPQVEFAQVGYPTLYPADSIYQYQLLRRWLQVCDSEHGHGPETLLDDSTLPMPTRLIHVGNSQARLEEVKSSSFVRYLALSHCWGKGPKLCTTKGNFEKFCKEIPVHQLPLNFRDAIRVARELGIPYLWIDSLCIIQDDTEDWEREAGRMDLVFSNAYCTITAASASSTKEGFLGRQTSPPLSATVQIAGGGALHISQFMEDYYQDLELAPLNTRGWVLQERALSRRTLHFTKTQVYWECGKSVHCERLFKLTNPKATLFGDSDFPKSILKYYKGGRITLFQDLYQRYSRLAFTHTSDRSVAILGLQQRLLSTFKSRGGFGIFDIYLERSLLWSRPDDTYLTRILYPTSRSIPSWSWMAYEGPITYMHVPFDRVDWTHEYSSPFKTNQSNTDMASSTSRSTMEAFARDLELSRFDLLNRVRLDQQHQTPVTGLRGVLIGKEKRRQPDDELTHYVLLVSPLEDKPEERNGYVRVGVAWLLEHNVGSDGEHVEIY